MPNWHLKWSDHLKFQSATSSSSSKADLPACLACRTVESSQCFENVLENGAVNVDAVLDPIDPMPKLGRRADAATQMHERAHDEDVHRDGPTASKNARQHRDALLGESGWRLPTAAVATGT